MWMKETQCHFFSFMILLKDIYNQPFLVVDTCNVPTDFSKASTDLDYAHFLFFWYVRKGKHSCHYSVFRREQMNEAFVCQE